MYKIIAVTDSYKQFEIPINEYSERLSKKCEIIKIKPVKNLNDNQTIEKETLLVTQKLEKLKGFKIVLNLNGKILSSSLIYSFIEEKKQIFSDIIFVIWGASWLDYNYLERYCDFSLSLWKITLPHSLCLLVLIEQIYRFEMMKKWTKYHK